MKLNGFNSDNYRYFYLNNSQNWSGFSNLSFGKLKENSIIKLSKADLVDRLFSGNYWNWIKENIYPHSITQYPEDKPFDLFEYLYMQEPITFKYNGVLNFVYNCGEFAYINDWMKQKMNSCNPSRHLTDNGRTGRTIKEENDLELGAIREEEMLYFNNRVPRLDSTKTRELLQSVEAVDDIEGKQLPQNPQILDDESTRKFLQKNQNKAFKFRSSAKFELEYNKDETWSLMNSSVFLAIFNQDFIRLLANSTEIVGQEKERIFIEEYQDNIPDSTRRYYKVKDGVTVNKIGQIMSECSLEHFNRSFCSLIVRQNVENVNTCDLNRDNFHSDGSIKYFYVDYSDNFNDRIGEQEILKIADRVSQQEALEIQQKNDVAVAEQRVLEEAIEYAKKHKSNYKKFCRRNPDATPVDFMKNEKKQQIIRLLKSMQKKLEEF